MAESMLEVIRRTIEIYRTYSGSSAYLLLFLVALFYLWFTEKDKSVRIVLIYLSSSIFVLFFFPLFAYLAMHYFLDTLVYYRFLWLLPVGIVVSLAAVRLIERMDKRVYRWGVGIACAAMIIASGSLIYQNEAVTKAENAYHLPAEMVAVANELQIADTWVKAVVPSELIQFIRQYDGYIMMPYGREMLVGQWEMNHDLYMAMEAETIHAEYITILCRENQVDYIVIRKTSPVSGDFEEFGFQKIAETQMYHIYMDTESLLYDKRMSERVQNIEQKWRRI